MMSLLKVKGNLSPAETVADVQISADDNSH